MRGVDDEYLSTTARFEYNRLPKTGENLDSTELLTNTKG